MNTQRHRHIVCYTVQAHVTATLAHSFIHLLTREGVETNLAQAYITKEFRSAEGAGVDSALGGKETQQKHESTPAAALFCANSPGRYKVCSYMGTHTHIAVRSRSAANRSVRLKTSWFEKEKDPSLAAVNRDSKTQSC